MATPTSEESLNYLYSLIPKGIKLGLKNISTVLDALGNPQQKSPTIHIAGTSSAMRVTVLVFTHLLI